jgi:single-strand DNA-binding protein
MASLNSIILIGNLTRDPELRYTQSGSAKAQFAVAVNRYWKDREGNRQEETTFVPIVVWGAQAENCANYLKKGRPVAVEGRLSIRSYTTEEGEQRKVTEVVANNVQFLGSPQGSYDDGGDNGNTSQTSGEDEVPF